MNAVHKPPPEYDDLESWAALGGLSTQSSPRSLCSQCAAVWRQWPRLTKGSCGKAGGPVVPEKRSAGGSTGQDTA
jgi:hypothetical protein